MRKGYWIIAVVLATLFCLVGCSPDASVPDPAASGDQAAESASSDAPQESSEPSRAISEESMQLDQEGSVLGLHFKYSSAWEKLEDEPNTVSFRIPGEDGDYYAVVTGETMDFSNETDPEAARQAWARNAVDFLDMNIVMDYNVGSPSYYYYDLVDGVETLGLLFFNGNDFYELECHGPGGDDASMLGTWTTVLDELTLD